MQHANKKLNLVYSDEDHIKTYHKHCYRYDAASFHPTFHATSSWKHSITGINSAERQWPDAVRSKAWGLLVTSTGIADCNMVWLYNNLDLPLIYTGKYGGGFESYSDLCSEYRLFMFLNQLGISFEQFILPEASIKLYSNKARWKIIRLPA